MTQDGTRPPVDPRRVLGALTDLFDGVAPSDRPAAEQELREAGVDPDALGRRFEALAGTPEHRVAHRPTPSRARRTPGAAPTAARWPRRLAGGAIAAALAGALAWSLGGDGTRLAQRRDLPLPAADDGQPRLALPRPERVAPTAISAAPPSAVPDPAPTPEQHADAWSPRSDSAWSSRATTRAGGAAAVDPVESAGADDGAAGWILDSTNWLRALDLLPPVVLERVKKGDYWYRVLPVDPVAFRTNYSKKFWDASEANAGKYDVDAETCGLKDVATGGMPAFYFGYPFPTIDPKDPLAACKLAWNAEAATSMGEGQGATFTLSGVDTSGEFKRIKMSLHALAFLGRHGGAIANPEGLRSTALTNMLEPQDVDGVAGLYKRMNDWTSQDKAWFYVPSTQRVRRVNAATRSDPVAGLDIFADDLNCYGGKVEYYKWKLVGEQNILAPLLSPEPLPQEQTSSPTRSEVRIPYLKAAYETPDAQGVPWLVVDNLVLVRRPVWVLEGESTDPYYNFGRVIVYMDKEMYRIYWKLVHNRAGEYFYNAMCAYHFSKSDDGSFSAVSPTLVVGVNDKTNRACLAGRASRQFIERGEPGDHFSLRTLTRIAD